IESVPPTCPWPMLVNCSMDIARMRSAFSLRSAITCSSCAMFIAPLDLYLHLVDRQTAAATRADILIETKYRLFVWNGPHIEAPANLFTKIEKIATLIATNLFSHATATILTLKLMPTLISSDLW